MSTRRSLVEDVRAALLDDLRAGRLVPGEKIPNETALAQRFDVSRPTLREALRTLLDSGHLSRRRGLGTFVAHAPRHRHALDVTLSYTAMIRGAGMEPSERVLGRAVREATGEEAARLALAGGARVVCVERVRTADAVPVVYSVDRIPEAFLGAQGDAPLDASLYDVLRAAGLGVRTGVATLTPVVADPLIAAVLGVADGAPLLRIEEVDFTAEGVPAMLSSEWHAPGVFELSVNRRAADDDGDGVAAAGPWAP